MKKFIITETIPATLKKVYEITAHNQDEALNHHMQDKSIEIDFEVIAYDDDAEFTVESEFEANHPGRLKEFYAKFNDLIEEYHSNLYLMNDVFKGANVIEIALLNEFNKAK